MPRGHVVVVVTYLAVALCICGPPIVSAAAASPSTSSSKSSSPPSTPNLGYTAPDYVPGRKLKHDLLGSGTTFEVVKQGYPGTPMVEQGDIVTCKVKGMHADDVTKVFFETDTKLYGRLTFTAGIHKVIRGFNDATMGMQVQEIRRILVPAKEAILRKWNDLSNDWNLPEGKDLLFEVEVTIVEKYDHSRGNMHDVGKGTPKEALFPSDDELTNMPPAAPITVEDIERRKNEDEAYFREQHLREEEEKKEEQEKMKRSSKRTGPVEEGGLETLADDEFVSPLKGEMKEMRDGQSVENQRKQEL